MPIVATPTNDVKEHFLRRLILFLSLLGMFVLGGFGIAVLIDTGLPGIGGELVIPATAITFAIWGFMGVMALWDARRAYQGFLITAIIMVPFALAPQLQFFALIGIWGAMLAYLSRRVHQRDSESPPLFD